MTGLSRTNLTIPTHPCDVPQHLIIQAPLDFDRVGGGVVSLVDIKWMAAIGGSRNMGPRTNPQDQGVPLLVSLWDLPLTNNTHILLQHHHHRSQEPIWRQHRRQDRICQATNMVTKTLSSNHSCNTSRPTCKILDRNLCSHRPGNSSMLRTAMDRCCHRLGSRRFTRLCHNTSNNRGSWRLLRSWPISLVDNSPTYIRTSPAQ